MKKTERLIYLDYNASAPIAPECAEAVTSCLELAAGNPSSKHRAGERAKELIDQARGQVAQLLNAQPAQIVFTSGGTESNHMAILGAMALAAGKQHVITSAVEHPSTLALLKLLETRGARISYLPVKATGQLDAEQVAAAIGDDTAMVSLLWANNETGVVSPMAEIAAICRSKNVLLHCDAVQAVGKVPVDVMRVPVDFLSLSGHKLHAPPGIGALYVRKGIKLPPLLLGHQERGRRGGTENVLGIAALAVACLLATDAVSEGLSRITNLRDRLERGIRAIAPFGHVNGAGAVRVGNTTNVCFAGLDGEALVLKLDRAGVCVSQGAACSAGGTEASHVLTAMGLSEQEAMSSIRFSLGRFTRTDDIDRTLTLLSTVIASLRGHAA